MENTSRFFWKEPFCSERPTVKTCLSRRKSSALITTPLSLIGGVVTQFAISLGKNGSPTTKSPELLAECRPLGCCILCLVIFWTTGNFPHVNLSKLLGPRPKASVGYQAKVGKWLTRWSCEVFIVWLIPPFLKKKKGWMMKGLMRSERQTNLHLCKGFASFSNSPTLPRN